MKPPDWHPPYDPQPRDPAYMPCPDEDNSILSYTGAGFPSPTRLLIVGVDFGTTFSGVAYTLKDHSADYSALSYTWGDQKIQDWPTNVPKTTTTMTEPQYEGFVLEKAKPLASERCPWARVEHRQRAFSRRSDLSRHTVRGHQPRHLCQKCENDCRSTLDMFQASVDAYPEATHQARWSLDNLTTGDHDPGDDGHTLKYLTWTDQTCRQCSCPRLSR